MRENVVCFLKFFDQKRREEFGHQFTRLNAELDGLQANGHLQPFVKGEDHSYSLRRLHDDKCNRVQVSLQ